MSGRLVVLAGLSVLQLACGARPLPSDDLGSDSVTSSDEWTTQTGDTPTDSPECRSDAECAAGNCLDGECVTCGSEADCLPFDVPCAELACVDGTCVVEPWPCSLEDTPCHTPTCLAVDEQCSIDFCDDLDGLVDARISVRAFGFEITEALDVGGKIAIFGHHVCGSMQVVRDRVADRLVMVSTSDYPLDMEKPFGWTWDELTAPLTIRHEDHAQCPPIPDGCGDYARGSVDVTLDGQPPARILDGHMGSGPGGYVINNRVLQLEGCEVGSTSSGVYVMQDACSECPQPDFHDTCLADPDLAELAPDSFSIQFHFNGQFQLNPHSDWHFECDVVGADLGVDEEGFAVEVRELDCAAIYQSFWTDLCEN